MKDYWKLFWAVIGAIVFGLQTSLSDGMSTSEWVALIAMALNAFGVWIIPDTQVLRTAKSVVTALLAGLAVLELVIVGGITADEWISVAIAVLTAGGVVADPRRPVHAVTSVPA